MKLKKVVSFVLCLVLLCGLVPTAFAAQTQSIDVIPINVMVGGKDFLPTDVNGENVPVFAYNGTTYAPLRALAEAYGLTVGYNQSKNLATVDGAPTGVFTETKGTARALTEPTTLTVIPINIEVNGTVFQPKDVNGKDVPVFAYAGTTYAPLRALAEAYGLTVGYDQAKNLATVDFYPEPSPEPTPEEPSEPPAKLSEYVTGKLATAELTYTYTHSITQQTTNLLRKYYYYIPSTYQPGDKLPLILSLHGSGHNATKQLNEGQWIALAEREGFIVIAPEAVAIHADGSLSSEGKSLWEIGQNDMKYLRWNATSDDPQNVWGVDDVQYLCDLIDLFVNTGLTDANQVYSTGFSHGAFMSVRLAVEAPDKIAGIGISSGLLANEFTTQKLSKQVKLVLIHGTNDPIVPVNGMIYGGFVWALSLDDTIDWFMDQYGLSIQEISKTTLPNKASFDGCTMARWAYVDSNGNVPVVRYVVSGGGHTWPGGTQYMDVQSSGPLCMDAQASELIWRELKETSLSKLPPEELQSSQEEESEAPSAATPLCDPVYLQFSPRYSNELGVPSSGFTFESLSLTPYSDGAVIFTLTFSTEHIFSLFAFQPPNGPSLLNSAVFPGQTTISIPSTIDMVSQLNGLTIKFTTNGDANSGIVYINGTALQQALSQALGE